MPSDDDEPAAKPRKRTKVSVYDAVAGRAGYEGFLTAPATSKYRDTSSTSQTAIPPDQVLFRRKGAPMRYEEDDIYCADRHLRPDQRLPDSDLLKTLHAYVSDFYAATETQGERDWQSMDETALLALGILLEEAAAQAVTENGNLRDVKPPGSQQAG